MGLCFRREIVFRGSPRFERIGHSLRSIDHRDRPFDGRHCRSFDSCHQPFHFRLNLPFDLHHHPFDRDSHLIDFDAARTNFQLDGLHGLGRALPQAELCGLIAHLDGERIISHVDLDVAVAHLDLMCVVALVELYGAVAGLDLVHVIAGVDVDGAIPFFDGDRLVAGLDRLRAVLVNVDCLAAVRCLRAAHLQQLVVEDFDRLISLVLLVEADFASLVVLDHAIEVLLRMDIDLLGAFLVLESKLIEVVGRTLFAAA